jgi:hypothetical protein
MPTYTVTDPQTGKVVRLTGDSPPTEAELEQIFASMAQPAAQAEPGIAQSFDVGGMRGAQNVVEGVQQLAAEGAVGRARSPIGGAMGVSGLTEEIARLQDPARAAEQVAAAQQQRDELIRRQAEGRAAFEQSPEGRSIAGRVGQFVGEAGSAAAIPAARGLALPARMAEQGAIGLGVGGIMPQGEDGSRGQSAAIGAAIGAAAPAVVAAAGKGISTVRSLLGANRAEMLTRMGGEELTQETAKRLEAAQRLGIQLTPAEATGDIKLAARQGRVGAAGEGGGFDVMADFAKTRGEQETAAINRFLFDLSPENSSAAAAVRGAASRVISKEESALAKAAKPYYDAAKVNSIPEGQLGQLLESDPVLKAAYGRVMSDPIWQRALGKSPLNSVQAADIVKKQLDDQIGLAMRDVRKQEAAQYLGAKRALLELADSASPDYAKARAIYSDEAPMVAALREGKIGKLADMGDMELKNVSRVLFDPQETDLNVLRNIADRVGKEDPEAWGRIVRNEIERRLDASRYERGAQNFYDSVLRKERDFQMFMVATKNLPEARRTLIDMKRAFANLLNPITAKTAAAQARSGVDMPRADTRYLTQVIDNALGGRFDRAAAEIITNPQWQAELAAVLKKNGRIPQAQAFAELLGRVQATQVNDEANQ